MVIIKLMPDQISIMWDVIKYGVEQARRPADKVKFANKLLSDLLSDRKQVLAIFDKSGVDKKLKGFLLVSLREYLEQDATYLYIENIYMYEGMLNEEYLDGMKQVDLYATNRGCKEIKTETKVERVKDILELCNFVSTLEVSYTKQIG